MSRMKDIGIIWIILGSTAVTVNGLECFTCNYDSDDPNESSDCQDNPSSLYLRGCGAELSHAPWRCQKSVKIQNGVTRLQRVCHAVKIEPNCYDWTTEMKRTHKSIGTLEIPEGEICYCDQDACNTSSKLHNTGGLIMLTLGFIIVMF